MSINQFVIPALAGMTLLLGGLVHAEEARGSLKVVVTGFRSNTGLARIGLSNSKADYEDRTGSYRGGAVKITNNKAELLFSDLTYGEYAIRLYHDENENNKFDRNWLGLPLEDYAFSNNIRPFLRLPPYKKAKFELNSKAQTLQIHIP